MDFLKWFECGLIFTILPFFYQGELNKNYSDEKRKEINGYQTIQEVENGAKSFIQSVESGNLNGWLECTHQNAMYC